MTTKIQNPKILILPLAAWLLVAAAVVVVVVVGTGGGTLVENTTGGIDWGEVVDVAVAADVVEDVDFGWKGLALTASGDSLLTTVVAAVVITEMLAWLAAVAIGELAVVTAVGKLTICLCGEL